jgi:asparagine synthase (glutamine-hydrolysing)
MCGFAGFIDLHGQFTYSENDLKKMTSTLVHRGPDDHGTWFDRESCVGLGHQRLSILDLSADGHQPMISRNGNYVIVYNGEIYNFCELRAELEKKNHVFRGHSDTEVILSAVEEWGVDSAVKRFVGMFAFALWNRKERVLYLVRDRLGEKPLYYGWMGKVFLFGSELKALRVHPAWNGVINRSALALYMRHNYIPAPYSIYQGINKLLPGTMLTISNRTAPGACPEQVPYWSASYVAEEGIAHPLDCSEKDAVDQLDVLLRESVRQKMIADVPLGAFLSGGIDSSTVVAMMQAQSNRPVKTFSIGFHEQGYNEARHAKAVAQYLNTEHIEWYVTPKEAMDVIPRLPGLYDEPFSDSSQIPTFLISQLTRRHVTVSLSGDGGDELFGGYSRYFLARNIWGKIGWMPTLYRQLLAWGITVVPHKLLKYGFTWLLPAINKYGREGDIGDKLQKLAEVLSVSSKEALYHRMVSHWKEPSSIVLKSFEPLTVFTDRTRWSNVYDFTKKMMFLDTISYLPDNILVKVDRASMGVSLEARVPLLDHRIVEFAWRIPLSMKIKNGQGKWLLRQVLYKYIPKELIDRPKMGFGVPIDVWLRGPLREWAEALLDEKRIQMEGFFNSKPIREKWEEHLSGRRNWQYYLWDVLMFQSWLDENKVCSC